MQQLNVQLYARTADQQFSEELSVRRTVTLTAEPTTVELQIKAPGCGKFTELRLDPDNKPSSFALRALNVRNAEGAELFTWDGEAGGLGTLIDLHAVRSEGQVILESATDDPFILIPLTQAQASIAVELTLVASILGDHPKELAAAVRSLQSNLRAAIDDLSNEQEALQESVLLSQAKSRSEVEAINQRFGSLTPALRKEVEKSRDLLLAGVRDDWRSVRQQIADVAEAAQRSRAEREGAFAQTLEAEFSKLRTAVGRVAASQDVMNEIRHELGIRRDEDAIGQLQKLKTELDAARDRIRQMENSIAWRITHPFGSGSND
jgi:hypothetical protein